MYILYIIILFLKRTEQIVVETEIRNTKKLRLIIITNASFVMCLIYNRFHLYISRFHHFINSRT